MCQDLLLHTQLIETTGGSDGIRDNIQAKAARLCYVSPGNGSQDLHGRIDKALKKGEHTAWGAV